MAGTTKAPITAILIIFELTNDYNIILPLMVSCLISTIVSSVLLKGGTIYTIKLLRRGLDIQSGMEQNILRRLKVADVMRQKIAHIADTASLADIQAAFREQDASYLHVFDEKGDLVGILSFSDIRHLSLGSSSDREITAGEIASREVNVISPNENLRTALHLMGVKGVSQLPVVSRNAPKKVLGILRQKDILTSYDKALVLKEVEE